MERPGSSSTRRAGPVDPSHRKGHDWVETVGGMTRTLVVAARWTEREAQVKRHATSLLGTLLGCLLAVVTLACGAKGPATPDAATMFAPNVDLFVVRGPATGSMTGVERWSVHGGADPATFLRAAFEGDTAPSMNSYLEQIRLTFHPSRIRVFYVKCDASQLSLAHVTGAFQFGLTDDTGLPDKGTVYSERAFTLNVLLAGNTDPPATFGGMSNLPGAGVMYLSNGVTPRTPLQFGQQLSHEIGHNFGLFHAFDPRSCLVVAEGTSNRVMDYSANMGVFVDCERAIAVDTARDLFGLAPVDHDASASLDFELFDGIWTGQRIIGSP